MLNELKTFKPSTVTSNFEHVVQEIGVPELTSIFSQKCEVYEMNFKLTWKRDFSLSLVFLE